jgi:class 3 adenylate cyclase
LPEEAVANEADGERKTVTALFADIKGSMELMEDIDPEEARAIVDPALKLMMDAAHRYDGYIVQSTGDPPALWKTFARTPALSFFPMLYHLARSA